MFVIFCLLPVHARSVKVWCETTRRHMADNDKTIRKVTKASNALQKAKEAGTSQTDARKKLKDAIKEYDK